MDFETWWEQEGQFCRSGVGQYEKTFAFRAWEAAHNECAKLCEEVVEYPPGHNGQYEGYGPVKTQRSGKECAEAIRDRIK